MKVSLRKIVFVLIMIWIASSCSNPGAHDGTLQVSLTEIKIPAAPALNGFAHATIGGRWLVLGGRHDGLHDHRPDRSYPPDSAANAIWLIDPVSQQVWQKTLDSLPINCREQLQAVNAAFYQNGNQLLIAGGYGWSQSRQSYITYPYLLVVDVEALSSAIVNNTDANACFTQITDSIMAVAGGAMGMIGKNYMLVFGQRFDGRYTTQPNREHRQQYTHQIRRFHPDSDGNIVHTGTQTDTIHFHRRDYNLLPQIFPDGSSGYTAFGGVFQYDRNFPWLYPVDITIDATTAVTGFEQKFNNYHCACIPVYHQHRKQMDNLFFGGMARYFPDDENREIKDDPLVPSINTIAQVSRMDDGSLHETLLDIKMPALLGAGASFIVAPGVPVIAHKIIDFDRLPPGRNLIGYIYGGLQSSHPNIFLRPLGTSVSVNRIFEVYLEK
ncbi:MAG: T9SS C-terminal target domain-containing protein [Clostridia bacterium]|nr:T9SS C-terminal target domain-containing protein [Clostridia bacterium]